MGQYIIHYESLVYNLALTEPIEILDHTFQSHELDKELEDRIAVNEHPLSVNLSFLSCCYAVDGSVKLYTTMTNNVPMAIELDDAEKTSIMNRIIDEVSDKVRRVERYLLFISNTHIFLPVTTIDVFDNNGNKVASYMHCGYQPIFWGRWSSEQKIINLQRRFGVQLNYPVFENFLVGKAKYSRAFDYYIKSFHETNHASAFCMLCAAMDAITGQNKSDTTKQRLAKYSSVLFCNPLKLADEEKKMRKYYKLRSKYVHGRGCSITKDDEVYLREYVHKFLYAYFLFWQELKVTSEKQMLQALDKIYEDHSLYMKLVPSSYTFIALMDEHEKQADGILNLPMQVKQGIVVLKLLETLIDPADTNNEPLVHE